MIFMPQPSTDKIAPTLTFCPGPKSVVRTEVWGVEVTFDLPTAQDNADQHLSMTTEPENLTTPFNFTEDTVIAYTFYDSAGNNVTCSFAIYVQGNIILKIFLSLLACHVKKLVDVSRYYLLL